MVTQPHPEPGSDAETLALRPLSVEDSTEMARVLSHESLYAFTGGNPPTAEELKAQYRVQTRGHSADGSETWWNFIAVVGEDEHPVGYVQATIRPDAGCAEIAWVIGRDFQGKRYASRAVALLRARLADEGVRTMIAHIHPGHDASHRVARSLGMQSTGESLDGEDRWQGAITEDSRS